jgi:hypothetical protein
MRWLVFIALAAMFAAFNMPGPIGPALCAFTASCFMLAAIAAKEKADKRVQELERELGYVHKSRKSLSALLDASLQSEPPEVPTRLL